MAVLLSGCLKYDLTLMVNDDDTLDGTLIVAVAREFAVGEDVLGRSGELTPSQGTVTKQAYEDADYIGSRYVISGVPISEIDALSSDSSTRFALSHQGDEYLFDASLDFNLGASDSIPTDDSFSAMVAMTFPGEVLESNGTIDGNTVTWTQLRADAENNLTARASAVGNGQAGSPLDSKIAWWIWALGGAGVLAVAGLVIVLVLRKRRSNRAAAASAESGTWSDQQQGGYGDYRPWDGPPGYGQRSGYYDVGQDGEYATYSGTYGDTAGGAYEDSYAGPPGTEPYPTEPFRQTGQPYGGYSGQTVVRGPDSSPPPAWGARPGS